MNDTSRFNWSPVEERDVRVERKAVEVLEEYEWLKGRLSQLQQAPREREQLREEVLAKKRELEEGRVRLEGDEKELQRILDGERAVFEDKVRDHELVITEARAQRQHASQELNHLRSQLQQQRSAPLPSEPPERTRSRIDTLSAQVLDLNDTKSQYQDHQHNSNLSATAAQRRIMAIESEILSVSNHAESTVLQLWDKVAKVEKNRTASDRMYKRLVSRVENLLKYQADVQMAVLNNKPLPPRPVALARNIYEKPSTTQSAGTSQNVGNEVVVIRGSTEQMGCTWSNADLSLQGVVLGSPADAAGVGSFRGRRLLAVNSTPVASIDDLAAATSGQTKLRFKFSR